MARTIVERPIEEYPYILQAGHVKDILGISEAKVYEMLNSEKCPTIRIGEKRMIVIRDSFMDFLYANQGRNIMGAEAVAA